MSSGAYDSAFRIPHSAFDRLHIPKFGISLLSLLSSVSLLLFLAACGGGGGSSGPSGPANVGGGYTLQVSGGTLNNGTATKGLVVLATLRNSDGNGPGGAAGWTITITGPGINTPLVVDYDDGSSSSYITWRWKNITPQTSTYKASATNGSVTLTYNFTIDASQTLPNTSLTKSSSVVSWSSVANAGSYYYLVTDGSGTAADYGYLGSSQNLFELPVLPDGSYKVEVYAHTKNRLDLMTDPSATPVLFAQENMSVAQTTFDVTGTVSGYYLNARGGTLYMGQAEIGDPPVVTDIYGLSIWTSIATSTGGTPPAGSWTVKVTGPGLPLLAATDVVTFTYPGTYSHYLYWDFGFTPDSGTYTVTATDGTATLTDSFSIPNITAKLPVATGISLTQTSAKGGNVSWNPVPGAGSYYVNIWTCVGAGSVNEPLGCTNSGVYTEIAAGWVNTNEAVIVNNTFTKGIVYDVYVTAGTLDMTTTKATPPPTPGTQVDMSDTYYTYYTFTAQ